MATVNARILHFGRTVMLRPQGGPCYGAACDCQRCQNLKITLATASGTREDAMLLRFISRLHSMEIVMMALLVLLGIRVIHLHRQTPDFAFPCLQSRKSTINRPSKSSPPVRDGIDERMVCMNRSPRCVLSVTEGDVLPSGNKSPWGILPKVDLESGIVSTPHQLLPTRHPVCGFRPPFAYEDPRKTYARWPVGESH